MPLFMAECDKSDIAVSAILSQAGHLVAFMSRMLSKSEFHYPPVEKKPPQYLKLLGRDPIYCRADTPQLSLISGPLPLCWMAKKNKNWKWQDFRLETGACLLKLLNPIQIQQEQCNPWYIIELVLWFVFFMELQGYSWRAVPSICCQNASFYLDK